MEKCFKGFTILEVIIVTIIIGILSALGFASLSGPKEQAADSEAKANLKLISSAEKVYRMEMGSYIDCANISEINSNLRLMLTSNNPNWNYHVVSSTVSSFSARAQRTSGPKRGRTFCIDQTQENATNGSSCTY